MVGSNLPPDVTPGDIDKHFGAPEKHTVPCEATVDVRVTEDVDPTDLLAVKQGEVVHVEDIERDGDEFIKCVYVGFEVETQFEDTSDIVRDARKQLSVTATDDRVTGVEHIETEVFA